MADLFDQCRVAYTTGILPAAGSLEDQTELFADVFPTFVARYEERRYQRVWSDVGSFVSDLLSHFKKK